MSITSAVYGTANLFGAGDRARSAALLDAAYGAGFRVVDTAPSYGFGDGEPAVGRARAGWPEPVTVVSKVGLAPAPRPGVTVRAVKGVARRLPDAAVRRLRGPGGPPRADLAPPSVRASVTRSLRRLGRVDRLMLHEADAADVTDELLDLLHGLRASGDVGTVGVATTNDRVSAVVERGEGLFGAVHLSVDPLAPAPAPPPPDGVELVVVHGALGPGGHTVRRLQRRLAAHPAALARWRAFPRPFAGVDGVAAALVARAAALPAVTDVLVATRTPARLPDLRRLAAGEEPAPAVVATALAALVSAERRTGPSRPPR